MSADTGVLFKDRKLEVVLEEVGAGESRNAGADDGDGRFGGQNFKL